MEALQPLRASCDDLLAFRRGLMGPFRETAHERIRGTMKPNPQKRPSPKGTSGARRAVSSHGNPPSPNPRRRNGARMHVLFYDENFKSRGLSFESPEGAGRPRAVALMEETPAWN
jgi:hypothetical protein